MSENLLSLVYSIITEPYKEVPDRYSQEFKDLIASMLLKDDVKRPSTSNILDLPYIEKYMKDFIKEKESVNEKFTFKKLPTAKMCMQQEQLQQISRSRKYASEKNLKDLLPKKKLPSKVIVKYSSRAHRRLKSPSKEAKHAKGKPVEKKDKKKEGIAHREIKNFDSPAVKPCATPIKQEELIESFDINDRADVFHAQFLTSPVIEDINKEEQKANAQDEEKEVEKVASNSEEKEVSNAAENNEDEEYADDFVVLICYFRKRKMKCMNCQRRGRLRLSCYCKASNTPCCEGWKTGKRRRRSCTR
eukprot:TRINITY_DN13511_c0_g2_i4.p1 TRINITY_DN13511_c0_g2~~TRINITY_DN13511_c0_g2_i4.p1  ORF type:complete len:303 (-),score=67.77 TRINITY_DN13511_c0_g2_i4:43-951(-)